MNQNKLQNIIVVLLLLLFSAKVSKANSDNPTVCGDGGDWAVYQEEACFKVLGEKVMNFEEAERSCAQEHPGSHLATIHSEERQTFLSKYLFRTKKVANDVWIGARFDAAHHRFNWSDGSPLGSSSQRSHFSNWAQGSPKNLPNYCIQLFVDHHLEGKWGDEPCAGKFNLALCERRQSWSLEYFQKQFIALKEEVDGLKKEIKVRDLDPGIPLGFIYVQLPKEAAPEHIWPRAKWAEVTAAYSGLFFRAEGGGSAPFGSVQAQGGPGPHISKLTYHFTRNQTHVFADVLTTERQGHFSIKTGVYKHNDFNGQTGLQVEVTGGGGDGDEAAQYGHQDLEADRLGKRGRINFNFMVTNSLVSYNEPF